LIRGAPSSGFSQGGAKYRSGSLVRRCDADFEPGRAGAHGSRADPIDRKNGE
jgi:hypothetical protein